MCFEVVEVGFTGQQGIEDVVFGVPCIEEKCKPMHCYAVDISSLITDVRTKRDDGEFSSMYTVRIEACSAV